MGGAPVNGVVDTPYKINYNDYEMKSSSTRSARLETLRRQASSEMEWGGKGGFTDRDLYLSLVGVAQKHGKDHPEGIEVSVSMRELSRIARVGRKAVSRALNDRLIP